MMHTCVEYLTNLFNMKVAVNWFVSDPVLLIQLNEKALLFPGSLAEWNEKRSNDIHLDFP